MKEALCYAKEKDMKVHCFLCPHHCRIKEGNKGLCDVRENIRGTLYTLNYGELSAIDIDPIEKKPLYGFMTGTKTLSIGSYGCNFRCSFCQNYSIAKELPSTVYKSPDDMVSLAIESKVPSISFTYNEPTIFYEYMLDTAKLAKAKGLKTIMVTNGFITQEALEQLLPYLDAMNIDLKTFDNNTYRKFCNGELEPVKATIKIAYKHVHVEVTTLVVTDMNDNQEELTALCKWLGGVDHNIILHLSRYFPRYKYHAPETDTGFLWDIGEEARKYLKHVYIGNV
ncbi:AmmeMemoRadiSam system radical SAM enzyme [Vallitalea pronyensis]|uniref:AmmeMemoRadiSam system radical SAM enzyme n=1 Tax=Vallitalea pronyensis TaxID=1348613 RepID=A0A8J8SJ93_9FIRM|nr:AmmeMemoRadiSam system radical SAM enzyme [Vallitalea pronyensis]QUI25257.1 AmmeMemoRadiSam system radical SAM enzyme [Vallitalea pronyensis]